MPEEVNRRVIDHCEHVLMPYTERSRANLLREGIAGERIYVTGNPIKQVLDAYTRQIEASAVLRDLALRERQYVLVTMHRAENVDIADRLRSLIDSLAAVHAAYKMPVVLLDASEHTGESRGVRHRPRAAWGSRFVEPLGFFDFVAPGAVRLLHPDGQWNRSGGGVHPGVPAVTIRDVTERPETIECGSNVLAGSDPSTILELVEQVVQSATGWTPPTEYMAPRVAETVGKIVLGYRTPDAAERRWQDARETRS